MCRFECTRNQAGVFYPLVSAARRLQAGFVCTLAIYFKTFERYPVVIAADRDEYIARPAIAPAILNENPQVVGGKDLVAGGTWLGINANGIVADC